MSKAVYGVRKCKSFSAIELVQLVNLTQINCILNWTQLQIRMSETETS